MKITTFLFISLFLINPSLLASDDHDHDETEKHDHKEKEHGEDEHKHDEAKKHGHEEKNEEGKHEHGESAEHSDEEEENSAIGPDKGILEKGERGIKLSEEATKSFGLTYLKIDSKTVELPITALVKVKNEKLVYLFDEGWIRRVHVKVLKNNKTKVTLELEEFKPGNQVLISGCGFVRTAELVAEEGMAHGHSH